jgi:hypothetical protein
MRRHDRLAALLITLGLGLAGCASTSADTGAPQEEPPPAQIAEIPGKDVKSVTLSEHAEKRLGVETTELAASPQGTTVPYSAVFYTPDGSAWVYTVDKPLTYVREQVVVANVAGAKGDQAFLAQSPPVGTTVVKTGAIELYGAEIGVSGE